MYISIENARWNGDDILYIHIHIKEAIHSLVIVDDLPAYPKNIPTLFTEIRFVDLRGTFWTM